MSMLRQPSAAWRPRLLERSPLISSMEAHSVFSVITTSAKNKPTDTICNFQGHYSWSVWEGSRAYSERNKLFYSIITRLIKTGSYKELATTLYDDFCDIPQLILHTHPDSSVMERSLCRLSRHSLISNMTWIHLRHGSLPKFWRTIANT